MLRSLEIQNFKGIRQGKLDELAQVNILVGRNNSGKSTILDALVLLRTGLVLRDFFGASGLDQIIRRRVDRGTDSLDYDELWFRMSTEDPLTLSAEFISGTKVVEAWHSNQGGNLPRFDLVINGENYSPSSRIQSERTSPSDTVSNYHRSLRWQEISSRANEMDANYLAFIHLIDTPSIRRPFQENYWYRLISDRKDKNIVQILNDIYRTDIEFIHFTEFPPPLRRMVAAFPDVSIGVDWLGDGFRYAVNILSLGVFLKGTALLVEELETHQHPESLKILTETLFTLAKEQDLQLFLTTHSMELITYALDIAEEKGIDLKLHHLTLEQEGNLRAIPLDRPNARVLMDMGIDPRMHYRYVGAK